MPECRTRGVSSVVAIALLVAIVVILAATMAVYAGSFGDSLGADSPPNAVLRTSVDDRASPNGQYVNITHESGQTVPTDKFYLDVDGAEQRSPTGSVVLDDDVIAAQVGDEWTATETVSINRTSFTDGSGNDLTGGEYVHLEDATIRIVFERSETNTAILYECAVGSPDCTNREA